jgi:hypothetical protein
MLPSRDRFGLGTLAKQTGKRISLAQANQIVDMFEAIMIGDSAYAFSSILKVL